MKKKGGLDDFKLYFEALPSEPKVRKVRNARSKNKTVKDILDRRTLIQLAILVPFVFQPRKAFNRSAILSDIDDRATMPKVPQANKKRTAKSKR